MDADWGVRGACSLASILQKRTLSSGKLDEIKIKANILGAFRPTVEKTEEVVEEVVEQRRSRAGRGFGIDSLRTRESTA